MTNKAQQHTAIDHGTITRQEIARHDLERPFAPENGQPLFAIGDTVAIRELMEEEGDVTLYKITGYYTKKDSALYASGKRYLLDTEAYWFPYSGAELIRFKLKTPSF